MDSSIYFMESEDETLRLDLKTDARVVKEQALWAGVQPGMRVADIGCGAGKTTFVLNELVSPNGVVVGIDISESRIQYAKTKYCNNRIKYERRDVRADLTDLGSFDFLWIRFLLEYYEKDSYEILANLYKILSPSGVICLIDLDNNCLSHYGIPARLQNLLSNIMYSTQKHFGFDPYAGRKLYSYLYDLGCENIQADLHAHHLIYGKLNEIDAFNWIKKAEATKKLPDDIFKDYRGGYEEFLAEFKSIFANPRRFTYTPVILCKGVKPHKTLHRKTS